MSAQIAEVATPLIPAQTRVTHISLKRVWNLGNYENRQLECSVEIAPGDNAGAVLQTLENIFTDLYAKPVASEYTLAQARTQLAQFEQQEEPFTEAQKKKIAELKATLSEHEAVLQKRQNARDALSTLNYTESHIDHKDTWDSPDDYVGN